MGDGKSTRGAKVLLSDLSHHTRLLGSSRGRGHSTGSSSHWSRGSSSGCWSSSRGSSSGGRPGGGCWGRSWGRRSRGSGGRARRRGGRSSAGHLHSSEVNTGECGKSYVLKFTVLNESRFGLSKLDRLVSLVKMAEVLSRMFRRFAPT